MSLVTKHPVAADEHGLRLDRWFHRHFPALPYGRLQTLLRTGQVRLDGRRAKSGDRLAAGQIIRVPPLGDRPAEPSITAAASAIVDHDIREIEQRILYLDDALIIIDKPSGLAVQGGSKTFRHIDACLDGLRFGGERPRLVHRLDKDTSGTLLLARTAAVAAELGEQFRRHRVRKVYWAVTAGSPATANGEISAPLARGGDAGKERMAVDRKDGLSALSRYRVIDHVGDAFAWLELEPLTGRTHQLRVHCAELGAPIVGDGKYGHRLPPALLPDVSRLHLHARQISFTRPNGAHIDCAAPLPAHMRRTFAFLGFAIPD